jgi:hypothetical protein
MSRLEVWLLHLSTFILTLTGLSYAAMHYLMKPADPFSVVNSPLEPYMMALHIIVAPLLILAAGTILHSHILWKLNTGATIARRSGILLIPLFVVMVVSGYFLQVITASWRSIVVVIHIGSGTLWFLLYVSHQLASLRFRRSIQAQNNPHAASLRMSE